MSEDQTGVNCEDVERGDNEGHHDTSDSFRADQADLLGVLSSTCPSSTEPSPSPSVEDSGLLSLPWEMVARIASHLPAQCVINVLPKVCHALGNVGKDGIAWQLRARRLTGSRAVFPVGPKEDFDWPAACLEMEELISRWAGQADWVAKQTQEEEEQEESERGRREGRRPGAGEERGGGDRRADAEEGGVGVAAQEVAFGVHEVALEDGEDGDMQPERGGREPRAKEEEEEAAAGLKEEERRERGAAEEAEAGEGADGGQEEPPPVADPGNRDDEGDGGDGEVDMEVEHGEPASRSPSPPPTAPLERISLPSAHIGHVNAVLLLGGRGAVCASASRDRNVNLWDLEASSAGGSRRGTLLSTLAGPGLYTSHQGWVWCLAARGPLLASGSFDSTVRLWDLEAGGAERGTIGTRAAVLCLSCQSQDVLLAGLYDKRVNIYDVRAGQPLVKSLRLHGKAVMSVAADDQYIISASEDHTVAVYDRRAGKVLKKLRLSSYLLSMCYSDSEVWAGDQKGMLHTFSMRAGALKAVSQFDVGHTSLVTGIHRSAGSLYTCSSDGTVKIHLPCAPPRTLCTVCRHTTVSGLSVEAGVLAVAPGDNVEVWRVRS